MDRVVTEPERVPAVDDCVPHEWGPLEWGPLETEVDADGNETGVWWLDCRRCGERQWTVLD